MRRWKPSIRSIDCLINCTSGTVTDRFDDLTHKWGQHVQVDMKLVYWSLPLSFLFYVYFIFVSALLSKRHPAIVRKTQAWCFLLQRCMCDESTFNAIGSILFQDDGEFFKKSAWLLYTGLETFLKFNCHRTWKVHDSDLSHCSLLFLLGTTWTPCVASKQRYHLHVSFLLDIWFKIKNFEELLKTINLGWKKRKKYIFLQGNYIPEIPFVAHALMYTTVNHFNTSKAERNCRSCKLCTEITYISWILLIEQVLSRVSIFSSQPKETILTQRRLKTHVNVDSILLLVAENERACVLSLFLLQRNWD